jgi:hypothetical protein
MSTPNVGAGAPRVNPVLLPIIHAGKRLRAGIPAKPKADAIIRKALAKHGATNVNALKPEQFGEVLFDLRFGLAQHLATIGPIFPVIPEIKRPALKEWEKQATQDPAAIRQWVRRFPNCNWGISLNVVDVDSAVKPGNKRSGLDTFSELTLERGDPDTYHVATPSKGEHFYVADELPNGTNTLGEGIDSRRAGKGYVVAAGSHVTLSEKEHIAVTGFYRAMNDKAIVSIPWLAERAGNYTPSSERGDTIENPEPLIDPELLAECLAGLDASAFRDQNAWFKLMCSCHHATAGQSFPEFYDWCLSDTGYTGRTDNIEDRWNSLHVHESGDLNLYSTSGLIECLRAAGRGDLVAKVISVADGFAADPPERTEADEERDADREQAKRAAREAAEAMRSRPKGQRERRFSLAEICEQWVWIAPLKRFINRDDPGYALDKEAFNDRFFYIRGDYSSPTRLLFSRTEDTIRKLKGMVYRPNEGEFTADGYWNGWRPSLVISKPGDTTLFDEHMTYLFPKEAERDLLLNWWAGVLQHPETKPRHQLMLIGPHQGSGKTFIPRMMRELLGAPNCQALTQDILTNGFTGWAMRTKFVWIEEIRDLTDSKGATAKLHTWASESTITINQKNLPTFVMDQVIAFMAMSNKRDAIAPDNSDRRYLVLYTDAKPHPEGRSYYDRLYGVNGIGGVLHTPELQSAVLHKLLSRPLGTYSIEGPAPFTAAKQAMIDASASEWTQWMLEHSGEAPLSLRAVTQDEVIEAMPKRLQNRAGVDRAVRAALRERFSGMPWPQQIRPYGRAGDKLRVWVIGDAGKAARTLKTADVQRMYCEDHDRARAQAEASEADDLGED